MCLSPKTYRSNNINPLFQQKNKNRNNSKEEKDNKLSKKKLSSRNNEIIKNQNKFIYKKIIPNSLIHFSSNNSTRSNTSYLNKQKFKEKEIRYKYQDYFKRNMKYFKRQDYSNILINNTKEKIKNIFQKYNKKTYNSQFNNSNYNNKSRHNRSLSKNLNQDSVISKIVDKLVIDNIQKKNKNDLENNLLGSNTTFNSYLKTNSKRDLKFPNSQSLKNIISINDINSLANSRHSAIMSSTKNIYSKKTSRQIKSNKPNRPNSNDNAKKNKYSNINNGNKKGKIINLSKTKDNNNVTFNNYYKKYKKYSNAVGLNNNKIEYVQINLFNNGHEDKNIREDNFANKIEKKGNKKNNLKFIKNNKEKEVKLLDNDINASSDGLYITKSFFNFNDKNRQTKDLCTPEESHFQAVNYAQFIKQNNNNFS
jgi:hypothetical protein